MPRDTTELYKEKSRTRKIIDRVMISVIVAAGVAAVVVTVKDRLGSLVYWWK